MTETSQRYVDIGPIQLGFTKNKELRIFYFWWHKVVFLSIELIRDRVTAKIRFYFLNYLLKPEWSPSKEN